MRNAIGFRHQHQEQRNVTTTITAATMWRVFLVPFCCCLIVFYNVINNHVNHQEGAFFTTAFVTNSLQRRNYYGNNIIKNKHSIHRMFALSARAPSKVSEEDVMGPSSDNDEYDNNELGVAIENADLPTMSEEDLLEQEEAYEEESTLIPNQPWRRGRVDGAQDPIDSPWRVEAEEIIQLAVERVGGQMEGITWYNGKCVITISRDCISEDSSKVLPALTGPTVNVVTEREGNDARNDFQWQTSKSGNNLYERQLMEDGDDNLPIMRQKVVRKDDKLWNTDALSSIAQSVLDALNDPDVDERLDITSRHEIILTTPGINSVLETQKEFDAFVGFDVIVKTIDPFKSNRTLKGKLVERNALDLKINVKGRIVTIPLNFVDQVVLPPAKREKGDMFNL